MIITKTRPDVSTATALTMLAMLQECADFLNDQADGEICPDGGYVGNDAAKLLVHVEDAIRLAENEIYIGEDAR